MKMLHTEFIPAKNKSSRRLMVILHGLGDSIEGFRWLPEALQLPNFNYLLVNAPDPYYGGFAWFDFAFGAAAGIERNSVLLVQLLDDLAKKEFLPAETFLLGFSQGSLMSIEVAARYPKIFGGIVGISGYVHEAEQLAGELTPTARQQRFLVTHGTLDPIVPFFMVRSQIALLQRAGFQIEWHEFMKAHTIAGESELKVIRNFILAKV